MVQDLGSAKSSSIVYSFALSSNVAGEVVEIGSSVYLFKISDWVLSPTVLVDS